MSPEALAKGNWICFNPLKRAWVLMPLPRIRPLKFLQSLLIGYALLCLVMWVFQRHLLYFPRTDIQPPEFYGLADFEDVRLRSKDGTVLQAWYRPAHEGAPTLIHFHGNAGHLGARAAFFRLLADAGIGVLGLSYRGYGHSQGSPSEQGFYMDARAVIQHAVEAFSLKPAQLVLYGESIGTGVAVQTAVEYPVRAVILPSPFASISDVAASLYPWLPVDALLADKFDSIGKIARFNVPLLIVHGETDALVPVASAKALYDQAPQPKEIFYFPDKGHNDIDFNQLMRFLIAFFHKYDLIEQPKSHGP